jgi:hypothetical protein
MNWTRWSRRSGVLLAIVALAVVAARDLPAGAEEVSPQPRIAFPAQGSGFTEAVCKVVRSEAVSSAASQLIANSGIPAGALLGQIVVTVVKNNCSRLVEKGVRVVRSIIEAFRPPRTPEYARLPDYLRFLPDSRAAVIARQLGTTAKYVLRSRDMVCLAVRLNGNPADVVAQRFPGARLKHLVGMNGFVHLVVDTCRALTRADANFVTAAITNLVLGNEFRRDLDPPAVQIYRTAAQRQSGGVTVVSAWFRWFDGGTVRDCDIYLWYRGAWHPRSGGCAAHSVQLPQGTQYAWAFRARDRQGHVSQWAVTYLGTT